MKRILMGCVAALTLAGCTAMPIEQSAPYRQLEVEMPARAVYDNLLRYPYCSAFNRTMGTYDSYDDTFFVKMTAVLHDTGFGAVSGEAIDENRTLLRVHNQAHIQKPQADAEMYVKRLLTGSCK